VDCSLERAQVLLDARQLVLVLARVPIEQLDLAGEGLELLGLGAVLAGELGGLRVETADPFLEVDGRRPHRLRLLAGRDRAEAR